MKLTVDKVRPTEPNVAGVSGQNYFEKRAKQAKPSNLKETVRIMTSETADTVEPFVSQFLCYLRRFITGFIADWD